MEIQTDLAGKVLSSKIEINEGFKKKLMEKDEMWK